MRMWLFSTKGEGWSRFAEARYDKEQKRATSTPLHVSSMTKAILLGNGKAEERFVFKHKVYGTLICDKGVNLS